MPRVYGRAAEVIEESRRGLFPAGKYPGRIERSPAPVVGPSAEARGGA